ncbi:MAG: hypothetical protein AB1454_07355 [Candidatus Auribacterota bacterium]|jgi:hypothetical protein|uniref:DUF91 domain-containing protein n=1 Tax=Candidatus Auribacter fodinae TaxID=2093366 RepID=A0A3A4R167_9BACT|nr:MAG: hypothetical protein C4541_05295 [Candidatus Auribacter fodinae]
MNIDDTFFLSEPLNDDKLLVEGNNNFNARNLMVSMQSDKELFRLFMSFLQSCKTIQVLDRRFGGREYGYVDILAVNADNQVLLIDFYTRTKKPDLSSLLTKFKFVADIRASLPKMFEDYHISDIVPPKLMILAPAYSPRFLKSLSFIESVTVDLYKYTVVEYKGEKKLKLARVALESRKMNEAKRNLDELKRRLKQGFKDATDEEIETFYNFYQ